MSRATGVKNKIKKCYNTTCEDYRKENRNRCVWPDEVIYCMSYVSLSEHTGAWERDKKNPRNRRPSQ